MIFIYVVQDRHLPRVKQDASPHWTAVGTGSKCTIVYVYRSMYRSMDWPLPVSKHAKQTCTRLHSTSIEMVGGNVKADDTSACREHSPTILEGKPLTFTGILKTGINLITQLIHQQVAQRHERPENLLVTNTKTPV